MEASDIRWDSINLRSAQFKKTKTKQWMEILYMNKKKPHSSIAKKTKGYALAWGGFTDDLTKYLAKFQTKDIFCI